MASPLDYLMGLGELGATLGTGAVSGVVGAPYGLYKGITSGKYGTPEGVRIAQQQAADFMARNTYQPRGQVAQEALQGLGSLLTESKLPPVVPEAMLLGQIPRQAYAAQAERAGMAAERAIEPVVQRTMAAGGRPAQLMTDLTQGSLSQVNKAPRMSAAEARAAGYWHDIGAGKKLPIPISEMTAMLEPVGNLPPKIAISPEKMQGGAIVSLAGDRSAAGQNLLGIGDTQFETPVYLQGGYDFMRANSPSGSIWASEKGAAQGLLNQINEAANVGQGDVYGVYTSMGPLSMNYNTMMSDALLEQMKAGKISKKNIAAFDKQVKAIRPEWKGVMNPESREQLESNGALRHAFVDRMQLDEFQNVGFPNIAYTRYAITDPLLLNEPMYSGGLAVGKMQPNSELITNPVSPHKTYNTQIAGEYFGALDQSVPKEIMFPDWYKMRREIGAPESGDVRSFQLANPIQKTNQEWTDNIMQYLSTQKSLLD
jgi:hypothetical protein